MLRQWHVFCLSLFISSFASAQISIDPNSNSFFLKVSPRGTYLFVDTQPDTAQPPRFIPDVRFPPTQLALVDLYNNPSLDIKPGDLLAIEQVGAFSGGIGFPDNRVNLGAVFGNNNIGFLFPGPLIPTAAFFSLATFNRQIPTDIPQDFQIFSNKTTFVQIPEFASLLLFSVNDSFFQ